MGTYLITGADRGIGQALGLHLCERGETVIAACLDNSSLLAEKGAQVERGVDVTSDAVVHELAQRLSGVRIDVLISNAGIYADEKLGSLDFTSLQRQFEVNALGPLRIVDALLPNLEQGAKVGIITSRMGSVTDNTSGGLYGYRMSKAAANMAGKSLAHDLHARGMAVALLHPGMVRTTLVTGLSPQTTGLIDTEVAARGLLERMDALTLETTGTFWHANGEVLPW